MFLALNATSATRADEPGIIMKLANQSALCTRL
jgi:hypothetical protein